MDNVDVARLLEEVADLLEIQDANRFRVRAYRTAARTIETLPKPVAQLAREGGAELAELPGIGEDLAGKIAEIVRTGRLPLLEDLTKKVPAGVVEMMRLPGIGPRRARLFHEKLAVESLADLEKAAREGRLKGLKGIGAVLEGRIARGLEEQKSRAGRFRLAEAEAHAGPLLEHLRKAPGIERLEVAGSFRRRRETVGDLDILVSSRRGEPVSERFVSFPGVQRVLARGPTRSAVALRSGLQADLRIVPPESFGAALVYFTGSKAHNIALRTLAVKRGLKINEYGVFRGSRRIGGRTEEEIYRSVGLAWIPPELREDRGEIEAARQGTLPRLVALSDIRGDLQMHTSATDGADSLADMVAACRRRGYDYVAITDHTKAVRVAGGLDASGFRRQAREIDALARRTRGLTILKGAEVDILPDGRLDLDEATLDSLDVVLVSVHSKFGLAEAAMTERVLKALAHPHVHVFAHPTGRLLGRREPYAIDMVRVARAAADLGVLLEVNAQPERLDLNDVHIRTARDAGARLVISSDAHRAAELDVLRFGVDQARRGGCSRADIANTRSLSTFHKLLRRGRAGAKGGGASSSSSQRGAGNR